MTGCALGSDYPSQAVEAWNGLQNESDPRRRALAFAITAPGEADLPGIHSRPLPEVVATLSRHSTWDAVLAHLPDSPA